MKIETIPQLIDALGGNKAVAEALGLKPSTVGEMKRLNSIRVRYWLKFTALAKSKKIKLTFGDIADMHDLDPIEP